MEISIEICPPLVCTASDKCIVICKSHCISCTQLSFNTSACDDLCNSCMIFTSVKSTESYTYFCQTVWVYDTECKIVS